ncbi:hypothetical protein P3S68_001056 [Capsicum galapagoense]
MLEAAHDISIYIHGFHNLDLFQQGWYHIKITMRWEDGDNGLLGTPSRILQYEASRVWRLRENLLKDRKG